MKTLWTIPALLLVTLLLAPAAEGAIQYVQYESGDSCGDINPEEPCYASSGSTTLCSDSWGCPACGLSYDRKSALCYRIQGAHGKCSCKPARVDQNIYGQPLPVCQMEGSCVFNRK